MGVWRGFLIETEELSEFGLEDFQPAIIAVMQCAFLTNGAGVDRHQPLSV